jgi:cytidylate kinase
LFLDARPTVRAKRRQAELARLYGSKTPIRQVEEQLHYRDHLDRSRKVGPLVKPKDAIELDTSRLSPEQVVRAMLRHVRAHAGSDGAAP